jgi:Fur family ferric uptake transcriptional regulator
MSHFTDQASQAIRHTGGRMTEQRQLIIDLLEQVDRHLDVEGIYERVRALDAGISIATVYRTLHILEEADLIKARYASPDHSRKFYEPVYAESEYHFTCRVCHKVIPFKTTLIQELKYALGEELGVDVYSGCICINGLCPDCAEKAARTIS